MTWLSCFSDSACTSGHPMCKYHTNIRACNYLTAFQSCEHYSDASPATQSLSVRPCDILSPAEFPSVSDGACDKLLIFPSDLTIPGAQF